MNTKKACRYFYFHQLRVDALIIILIIFIKSLYIFKEQVPFKSLCKEGKSQALKKSEI